MANINVNELTKEQIEKAMQCKTAEELMAAAKAEGIELTEEEAKAYMEEMADFEVDSDVLQKAAGGICWQHCVGPYKDVPCKAYCPVALAG